jgi:hypothetical protein
VEAGREKFWTLPLLSCCMPNARFVEIESRLSHEGPWERYVEEIVTFLEKADDCAIDAHAQAGVRGDSTYTYRCGGSAICQVNQAAWPIARPL